LLTLGSDGATEKRIGSIVESPDDRATVMRYNEKEPYKGRMRIHPGSLVECFGNGVVRIEIKVAGGGWIRTTPRNVLADADIMWSPDSSMWEFYLPLPEWDEAGPLKTVFVRRRGAEVVWLEPIDPGEVRARYLPDETAEQLTLC